MKRVKTVWKLFVGLIILLIIAFIGLFVYATYFYNDEIKIGYMAEMSVKDLQFEDDFEEICEITSEHYSLYRSKSLNMDSLRQVFSARIRDHVKSKTDYGQLLQEYFAALEVGHSFVHFKNYMATGIPVMIHDSLFICAPDEYLRKAGFEDKDRVLAVDGLPGKEWLDGQEKYIPASTAPAKRLLAARKLFKSFTDSIRTYQVVRGEDTLSLSLTLKREESFPVQSGSKVEWKVLHDSIGYIAINSMMDSVVDDFVKAYWQVASLPYLVVDVRSNGGGNSHNGMMLCQYLIKKGQNHCVSGASMNPTPDAYKGRLYLLTSPFTFSAAESFVLDMKESGNAVLVGEPTAGDTGNNPRRFKTSHGVCFTIPTREPALSFGNFPMEGVGIPPHYCLSQTVSDFLQDKDTQLDFVISMIQL